MAGNWKMNKDFESGLILASEIIPMVADELQHEVETIIIPPFIHLHAISRLTDQFKHIATGAQDCSSQASGAYTGGISAEMVKSTGADYVLVGHSERRQYQGETNELCFEKIQRSLSADLQPIYCIGESKVERVEERYEAVIQNQLAGALHALVPAQMNKVIIAYEPVWAIGTGLTASPEQAQAVHQFIRNWLAAHFGAAIAEQTPILYGGSVNAANAKELFGMPDIDGGLVGGASLKSRDFTEIVKANFA